MKISNHYSAGVRDSELTVHGSLQASRLGDWFVEKSVELTYIFSSDLQRAYKTAQAIRKAQLAQFDVTDSRGLEVKPLRLLQERDFGSYEGKPFGSRNSRAIARKSLREEHLVQRQDVETQESMDQRMNSFLDRHLLPLLSEVQGDQRPNVAIVSHGIALGSLWRCLMKRFAIHSVSVTMNLPGSGKLGATGTNLEHLGGWSNTGFLELDIKKQLDSTEIVEACSSKTADTTTVTISKSSIASPHPILYDWTMAIKAINSKEHLNQLKRTRGGVGSSAYDCNQKNLETFFKRVKTKAE